MRVRNLKALPMIDFFIIVELDVPFLASPVFLRKLSGSNFLFFPLGSMDFILANHSKRAVESRHCNEELCVCNRFCPERGFHSDAPSLL